MARVSTAAEREYRITPLPAGPHAEWWKLAHLSGCEIDETGPLFAGEAITVPLPVAETIRKWAATVGKRLPMGLKFDRLAPTSPEGLKRSKWAVTLWASANERAGLEARAKACGVSVSGLLMAMAETATEGPPEALLRTQALKDAAEQLEAAGDALRKAGELQAAENAYGAASKVWAAI